MNFARLVGLAAVGFAAPLAICQAHAEALALRYDVYAGGTQAVEMEAEIEIAPTGYRLGAALELVGVYALFSDWQMATSAQGRVDADGIAPTGFNKVSEGGERWAEISYFDGAISGAQGNPSPSSEDTSTVPDAIKAAALDPLSGIVGLLHQVATSGSCSGTQHLYDGKSYFTVTAVDRGAGQAPGSRYGAYAGPAALCRLTIDHDAPYGRTGGEPRTADIWLAQPIAGAPFVPVRIETETSYGAVRVHLGDYWPVGGATARAD